MSQCSVLDVDISKMGCAFLLVKISSGWRAQQKDMRIWGNSCIVCWLLPFYHFNVRHSQTLRCPTWRSIAQHWPRKTLRTNFLSCAWCYYLCKYCPLICSNIFHTTHSLAWVDISRLGVSTWVYLRIGVWYVSCLIFQIWTCMCNRLNTHVYGIETYKRVCAASGHAVEMHRYVQGRRCQCHRCQDAEYLLKLDPPVEYICVSFAQKGKWSSVVSVFCCSFFWVVNWGQSVDFNWMMHMQ